MEQWLRGPDAPLRQDDSVRVSAQERTIGILPGLSPAGKRRVVRFLHRHELIKVGTARISLAHADLSSANLSGLGLQDSLLTGANLRDANLSDARLCHYEPTETDWQRAFERGVLGSLSAYTGEPSNWVRPKWGCVKGSTTSRVHPPAHRLCWGRPKRSRYPRC
jgi:hypothetical protein